MKHLITLDYELFFGSQAGSVDNCMLKPTKRLLEILDSYGIKATFFVDVGYLVRAQELQCDLENALRVEDQLKYLHEVGHDIQLHIHPHWHRTEWRNQQWQFDLSYYKLSDYDSQTAATIVKSYSQKIRDLTGRSPIAYRAGGWCIQPFSHFSEALYKAGVRVDSTVYMEGLNESSVQGFDFTGAPEKSSWRFNENPLVEEEVGRFVELPISSAPVSPLFFWQFAVIKKIGSSQHQSFGDGSATSISKAQLTRLLTETSRTVASIDGYKSKLLDHFRQHHKNTFGKDAPLVLIGHPKALSRYSLKNLSCYLRSRSENEDTDLTISEWYQQYEK